jgi:RNA polymerase sigma-70 factor (ECF subfamily)
MSSDSVTLILSLRGVRSDECDVGDVYRELQQPLLRYLVSLGLSGDEARDTIQDAFLTLHQQLAGGRSKQNLRGWVFRVAHNLARNRQRRYERRFASSLDAAAAKLVAHDATPERAVIASERIRQLCVALGTLSQCERECLFLRAEGLRYREIGEVLELPTSTVADTVARAIRKLVEKCDV